MILKCGLREKNSAYKYYSQEQLTLKVPSQHFTLPPPQPQAPPLLPQQP